MALSKFGLIFFLFTLCAALNLYKSTLSILSKVLQGAFDCSCSMSHASSTKLRKWFYIHEKKYRIQGNLEVKKIFLHKSTIENLPKVLAFGLYHAALILEVEVNGVPKYFLFESNPQIGYSFIEGTLDELRGTRKDEIALKEYKPLKGVKMKDIFRYIEILRKEEYDMFTNNCVHFVRAILSNFCESPASE